MTDKDELKNIVLLMTENEAEEFLISLESSTMPLPPLPSCCQ